MASITIRKLDDAVKVKLRIRAAQHGRSMEEEAREILESAVSSSGETQPDNLYTALRKRLDAAGIDGVDFPEYPRGPMRKPPTFD